MRFSLKQIQNLEFCSSAFFAKIGRRAAGLIFEDVIEASNALKSAFEGDLGNGHIGLGEQIEGAIGAKRVDVIVEGHRKKPLKCFGKVAIIVAQVS